MASYPDRHDIARFVKHLGPDTLAKLFARHGTAESRRLPIVEEALRRAVVDGYEGQDFPAWLLDAIEHLSELDRGTAPEPVVDAQAPK